MLIILVFLFRFMLGLAGVPSVVMFFGFMFLPESPRWLLKKERSIEAREVLVKLRGTQSVDWEIGEIRETIEAEGKGGGEGPTYTTINRRLFKHPKHYLLTVYYIDAHKLKS